MFKINFFKCTVLLFLLPTPPPPFTDPKHWLKLMGQWQERRKIAAPQNRIRMDPDPHTNRCGSQILA